MKLLNKINTFLFKYNQQIMWILCLAFILSMASALIIRESYYNNISKFNEQTVINSDSLKFDNNFDKNTLNLS